MFQIRCQNADVDFWFEPCPENFSKLQKALNELGFEVKEFPEAVLKQEQNISIKFSPVTIQVELINNFSVNHSFDDVLNEAVEVRIGNNDLLRYSVISYDDLILSKIKSARPKDLLDIQELERIRKG